MHIRFLVKLNASLIFFVLLFATSVAAAPVISSVSGTIENGQGINLSGSGFGPKSAVPPVIWDTFEAGYDGQQQGETRHNATIGTWQNVSGRDHVYNSNNNRHINSTGNVFCNMKGSLGNGGNDCYFSYNDGVGSLKWYVSYWFKLGSNFTWGKNIYPYEGSNNANIKFIRFLPIAGTPNENVVAAFHTWTGRDNPCFAVEYVQPSYSQYLSDGSAPGLGTFKNTRDITLNVWHHMQFEYAENSAVGATDGVLRWWFDGTKIYEKTNMETRDLNSNRKYVLIAGFFDSWDDSSTNDNEFYLDDIYIDQTWVRVELGNSATYNTCTHRELQIPTAWSDSSIDVTLNQGSFAIGQTVYLYVIDANGNVNTQGFPIIIGGSTSSSIPTPPPTISPTPTPTPTPTPAPDPTSPPSSTTTSTKKGLSKGKKKGGGSLQVYVAMANVDAAGSPIGNLKSYEITTIDNSSNPTNSSNPMNPSNPSNPTNPSNSSNPNNLLVVDAAKSSALDSDNQIRSSSKSFWSSEIDGKQVNKGGVGEVLLARTKPRNIVSNIEASDLMRESNKFLISNGKLTPELLGLSPGDAAGREKLIQYVHGYDSTVNAQDKSELKKRKWILGPIVNSRPLAIPYEDLRSVIFVGANDGMLHAFDNATGEELWGFIPHELLGRLKDLTSDNGFRYFVDGSPKAYVTDSQKIIIFGLGKGGNHYYALDVTNPDSPKLLWEVGPETTGFSELGQSWSTPQIGKVRYETGEKVVAFIGGGYDENQSSGILSDKKGRAVYAIDVLTGTQIWRWDHGKDGNMDFSIPSDISCVDTNGDLYIDRLYVGDTGGRLWRFDITDSGPNTWSAKVIFDTNSNIITGGKRKIFYRPDVTLEKGYELVFFGTGDREHPSEIKTINQIYAIKDKGVDSHLSMKDLENVTFGVSDLKALEGKEGWFINLEGNKGEKAMGPPVIIFGVTYFSTFAPSINSTGGTARLYALNYRNGDPILNLDPSKEQDGAKIDLLDRSRVIGTGIPSNTVISALDGLPIAFTGFSGGLYNTPLRKNSTIIPIWWKEVSKK